ncbi:MAG TPA: T9SS type A sorting domain-containing protein [Flavobacteriales bacterium]
MKKHLLPLVHLVLCTTVAVHDAVAQNDIENVIVETYYISGANDATDTIGGGLAQGSRTYRVHIDLAAGASLRALYGNSDHPLRITSTAPFFNHLDRGRTYGHEINNGALDEGTTALDSWLSLGAASNQRYGIPKADDTDGSIIGGANNDGGSAEIAGGLLVENDPAIIHALTERDGLTGLNGGVALPPNFNVTGDDPVTVFRDSTLHPEFLSTDVRIGCSTPGVHGPTADNIILVAQLTTIGELSFELNIEVQRADGTLLRYVASDSVLNNGETASGLLSYPPVCGCTDPDFLEYDPTAGCDDGSCQTAIVFGCMDQAACNYDPGANFHVPVLCCYGPDQCNGLDIALVCPTLNIDDLAASDVGVHPNPVIDRIRITSARIAGNGGAYTLLDGSGRSLRTGSLDRSPENHIDVSALPSGVYLLRIGTGERNLTVRIIKT